MCEMMEEDEGSDEATQVADLKMCIERLKAFISSEIQEGMREDGSLAMAARGGLTKAEHADHINMIHKAAAHVMGKCMKAMGAMCEPEDAEKVQKGMEEAHAHMMSAHSKAADICERCMKMGSSYEAKGDAEADGDGDDHMGKMFKRLTTERDGLSKALDAMQQTLESVKKRLAVVEAQPEPRKGAKMVIEKVLAGHEPKNEPEKKAVETPVNSLPSGLSPAAINKLFHAK